MRTRIYFCISVVCAGALLLLFVFVASEQPAQAGEKDCIPDTGAKKLGGRAWNSRIGWITHEFEVNTPSGNKPRCFLSLQKKSGKALPVGEVRGWSWSRFGYICWGATCKEHGNNDSKKAPNDNNPNVEVYKSPSEQECKELAQDQAPKNPILRRELEAECNKTATNKVRGWVKILALHGKTLDNGWVCLSPDTWPATDESPTGCDTVAGGNRAVEYGVLYDPIKNEFKGKAWSPAVGWIVFSGSTIAEADAAICAAKADQIIIQDPTKCAEPSTLPDCKAGLVTLCKNDINNFSYNLQKKASKWKTSYVGPGIRVTGGNAYSLTGFGRDNENNISTVDYLVFTPGQAIGFQELCRESSAVACKQYSKKIKDDGDDEDDEDEKENKKVRELRRTKKLPVTSSKDTTQKNEIKQPSLKRKEPASDTETPSAVLRSSIGSLDVDKLIKTNSANKNAYGNIVKVLQNSGSEITDAALEGNGCNLDGSTGIQNCQLPNTVVVIQNNDFHITKAMKFLNVGVNSTKGGVTFVIKGGNLKIDSNLYYDLSQVDRLDKLASVSWIVLKNDSDTIGATGNILFGDCIPQSIYDTAAQAVGIFFAENSIYTGTGKDSRGRNADGSIIDGAGSSTASCDFTAGALPFQVNGMMMARKLVFERVYEGDGSEEISYDGRLLVSVPPGLSDVLKKMPTWSP